MSEKGVMPDPPGIRKFILHQDDFIEWVLQNTNDVVDVFRVYVGENYVLVGIDRNTPRT